MKRTDLILFILSVAGKKGLTPVQLQKILFLVQKEFPHSLSQKYAFEPYNYGPFDRHIYFDVDSLVDQGVINKKVVTNRYWQSYSLNPNTAKEISKKISIDSQLEKYIKALVPWVQELTFEQLLASIYKKYPEYKKNSIFRE